MAAEHAHSHSHSAAAHGHAHDHPNYVKIWAILLALLVVSVIGPMFEVPVITLITAFGIAVVKAYLVAVKFMHISIEKRYILYIVTTCLVFMLLFFAGAAPDVMREAGDNWVKPNYHTEIPAEAHGSESHGSEAH
jgi:caa(3)-type oxidase subunit IV